MNIGTSTAMPGASSQAEGHGSSEIVSPWSCFHCRRRKARCNRCKPCALCAKSGFDCSYPVSGRMPTRQHYPSAAHAPSSGEKRAELINRLRYLEDVVDKLSSQVQVDAAPSDGDHESVGWGSSSAGASSGGNNGNLLNDFGRLHIHEGRSLYIGNKFWSMFNSEVKSVRQAFEDDDRHQRLLQDVPVSVKEVSHTPLFCSMMPRSSETVSQPLPSQVPYIWQIYIENVDPLIKILHLPTMEKVIRTSKGRFESLGSEMRALMFAISLAAITSLSDMEVQENFNESKDEMVSVLIQGTEQSLAIAGVLDTTSVAVAQAFLIYLEVTGRHYGVRALWTMTGILVRSAVSMGLHRDGSKFPNVDHFNSEMRRRLWWHICFIDNRVSQCDVPEMALNETIFDTREPANVNDTDIFPGMTHEPVSREGFTDSSYMLAHCAMWRQARHLHNAVSDLMDTSEEGDKAKKLGLECLARVRSKVLGEILAQPNPPQVLITVMRLVIEVLFDQLTLIIHHRDLFRRPDLSASEPLRHQSFESAVGCLEKFQKWNTDPSTRQWSWVSVNYHQWHAACIIFAQLRFGPWNAAAEKGWTFAMRFLDGTPDALLNKNPLKTAVFGLVAAAKKHRNEEMQRISLEKRSKESSSSQTTPSTLSINSSRSAAEGGSVDPMTWAWVSNNNQLSSCPGTSTSPILASASTDPSRPSPDAIIDADMDVFNLGSGQDQLPYDLFTNVHLQRDDINGEISGVEHYDQDNLGIGSSFDEDSFNFYQFM